MQDRLRLYARLERGARGIAVITLFIVALSAIIVSVMLFIRANNQSFADNQQQLLVGCDVRVELTSLGNIPINITPKQAEYLESLRENGCRIESFRQFSRFTRVKNGYDILVFRVVPNGDLPELGVKLSLNASQKLGLNVGDYYQFGDNETKLPVLSVEHIPVPETQMSQLGIIVLPESIAQDIALERNPLYIQISAPESMRESVVNGVKEEFPNRQHLPEEPVRTYARDIKSLLEEHIIIQTVIENVLLALSITAILLSIGGIVAVMRLRTEQRKQSYTLLRVNGMTMRDANRFALSEAAIVVFAACVIGVLIGFAVYNRISLRMTGLPPVFGAMSAAVWTVALKTAALLFIVLMFCLRFSNKSLFNANVMRIRRQREERTSRSFPRLIKGFAKLLGYILLLALLLTLILLNVESLGNAVSLFITNMLIIAAVGVLFSIIYIIFKLCVSIVGRIRPKLSGVLSLSARLVMKRRNDSALIGTAISVGLAMLLVFYNVSVGMDTYFKRIWEYEMKYGASVEAVTGGDAERILTENGFEYDTIYRKTFIAENPPQSNASPAYRIAVIEKNANSDVELSVEKGTFLANFQFLFLNRMETGERFTFFGELDLLCAGSVSNMNTTGTVSSVTYSAILDYADAGSYVEDDWSIAYLLMPNETQTARLVELGNEHGWYVTTPARHAESIRAVYANYLSLIYMVCVLLSVVVLVFVFSLTMVSTISRRREFSTYKVFGASPKAVGRIVVLENSVLAVIAAVLTTALVLGLFKLIGMALTSLGGVSYTMPIWVMLSVVVVAVGLSALITLTVVSSFNLGRTVDVLREE